MDEKKKSKKRILITVIAVIFLILSALLIIYSALGISEYIITKKNFAKEPQAQNGVFEKIDFSRDVTADETYLGKNRYISYTNETGAVTENIVDGNYEKYGEDIVFFAEYFDYLISGDYNTFDTLFTKSYFKNHPHTDTEFGFTKQGIYDIHISYAKEYTESNTEYSIYEVVYKIYENDGTFRRDIGSGESRPQYITLAHINGEIYISDISYNYDYGFDYSKDSLKTEIIAGIAGAVIAAAVIILLVARRKRRQD